ncbi:MAG: radical SAM/Cys-rich protein [Psychrobacter glaciei]|jgi:radical SAM/Cys-rich protein
MLDTKPLLVAREFPAINRDSLEILQVNLGYLCNLSCTHCHVNAGPTRTELMDKETIDIILEVIRTRGVKILDLTGGAPEMNPHFRYMVTEARKLGVEVIDRSNITILCEPGYEDLGQFLVDQQVTIVASLPCYTQENVDAQRGKGVFDASIIGLHMLNDLGYGKGKDHLPLHLVYNPSGASLPPAQEGLKQDYKKRLKDDWNIEFDDLYTITNMPISRFGAILMAKGQFHNYMQLLIDSYQASNLDTVMCRNTVSVDYQGNLYDCDFNQMLEMPIENPQKEHRQVSDLLKNDLTGESITVAGHCFGCTAGAGSSCSGSLS